MRTATPLPPLGPGVAVAMLAGATVVQALPGLPPAQVSLPLLVLALLAFARQASVPSRAAAALLVGLAWACVVAGSRMHARLPDALVGSQAQVEGRVLGLPDRGDGAQRFDLRVDHADQPGLVGAIVRVGWYGPRRLVEPGSRWRFDLRLKPPRGVLNPGGVDVEQRSLAAGRAATGTVLRPRSARVLSGGRGVDDWRDRMSARIADALGARGGRFVQALAVGDTRQLDDADWERLRATGLTHQIAISGFHVGLVAGFGALLARGVFALLPVLGRRFARPQASALAACAAAGMYCAMAGSALPTQRTLLMIVAVLAARLTRRASSAGDGLSLSLIFLLALDPLSVLFPGFWLSFAGVAWLLWCLPRESIASPLRGLLGVQWIATIGLLPLTALFFGQASASGPLANLAGVPLISLAVVPCCLFGLLMLPVNPPLAEASWHAAAWMMDALWSALGWLQEVGGNGLFLSEPTLAAVMLAAAGAFWWLLPRGTPGKLLAALLWLPLVWPALQRPPAAAFDVEFLDVGHGVAVVVTTQRHALLFDTGPAGSRGQDAGASAVVPALRARGIGRLDEIIVSQGGRDHAGGLDAVRRAYGSARVIGPRGWARPGMGICSRQQRWSWDGVEFRILHPPPEFPYLGKDSSCVLRVSAGGRVALLPGDIGTVVQARLVAIEGPSLRSDLLLAPRYGGRGSVDAAFLEATQPASVVFSTAWHDRGGLPREDVVSRWAGQGASVWVTASTGALRFRIDPTGCRLLSERRRQPRRFWREPPTDAPGYAIEHASEDLRRVRTD